MQQAYVTYARPTEEEKKKGKSSSFGEDVTQTANEHSKILSNIQKGQLGAVSNDPRDSKKANAVV